VEMATIKNSFMFSTFYYKSLTIEGKCENWNNYIDNDLSLPFKDLRFNTISTSFVYYNFDKKINDTMEASCSDKNIIDSILSSLRTGVSFEANCNGNSWRVFSCGLPSC